jgi:hypothetical protein
MPVWAFFFKLVVGVFLCVYLQGIERSESHFALILQLGYLVLEPPEFLPHTVHRLGVCWYTYVFVGTWKNVRLYRD